MQKILVIDDEEISRELLKKSLESEGYEVVATANGEEGLRLFNETLPDLVLTDVRLPGMDATGLLKRVEESGRGVEVMVILGCGQTDLLVRLAEAEPRTLNTAPVSDETLRVALRRIEERAETRRQLRQSVNHLKSRMAEAREEIRKHNDLGHRLIDISIDGVIANDLKGNIIVFNDGAVRICGYARQAALSHLHVTELYADRNEAREIKKKIYSLDHGGRGRLIDYETLLRRPDGTVVPTLLSATLIYENGQEVATIGFFKDLSEIKRLQRELLEKTRLAAIGEAMSEVAHSIKNILYGMKLGGYMVDDGLGKEDLALIDKGWRMVGNNIERISRLSLDMLSYARSRTRERLTVPFNSIVEDVCASLEEEAAQRGVELRLALHPGGKGPSGDTEQLHACVLNLVSNALEAFPEGTPDAHVDVRTRLEKDDTIVLEVEDNGRGMSEEVRKQIFKPLFTTKGARGTGLGLSITEKLIVEHGGRIEVESKQGVGSLFRVLLPGKD